MKGVFEREPRTAGSSYSHETRFGVGAVVDLRCVWSRRRSGCCERTDGLADARVGAVGAGAIARTQNAAQRSLPHRHRTMVLQPSGGDGCTATPEDLTVPPNELRTRQRAGPSAGGGRYDSVDEVELFNHQWWQDERVEIGLTQRT